MQMQSAKNQNACRNYKRSTASPRKWLKHFRDVAKASTAAQIYVALGDLVPRLLARGQSPDAIEKDLSQLLGERGFVVAPVVSECALQRGAA
ncbi:hypothetical protein [Ralstonia pseudosolanacearum]|uniref:hypothetical protein n=1 Tax=Ralstonia pseudosolanacearum TaxID=1310165 RepID=UPI001315675B|nr:hypothetical protein [Ralstonia pseudosolanacearum]